MPLPLASFWVLTSYYVAQALIVGGWLRRERREMSSLTLPKS
jgi:hypothetical protein